MAGIRLINPIDGSVRICDSTGFDQQRKRPRQYRLFLPLLLVLHGLGAFALGWWLRVLFGG